jgi:hypothetical protein
MAKTFIKITNQDIYDELQDIKRHVMETNGTVKWHTKALYGLSSLLLTTLGWIWSIR